MNFTNLIKVAFRAIANNKFRSFLSMLGIIIGVAAVIIMMAIGQGSKESVRKNISQMGTNIIMIRPGADMRGGVRQDPSEMQTLKIADYTSIKENTKFISYVSPEVSSSGQAIYGANNTSTSIYGESVEYLDIKQWNVEDGQMFTSCGYPCRHGRGLRRSRKLAYRQGCQRGCPAVCDRGHILPSFLHRRKIYAYGHRTL